MSGLRLAVLLVLGAAPHALAAVAVGGRGSLGDATSATAAYHSVSKAKAAGYTFRLPDRSGATCIAEPGVGAMGVHMVNKSLLDSKIDASKPEAMVYEPGKNGKLGLAAVEYVVFESAWKGAGTPQLFGRSFAYTPEPNRYGLPAFYSLHAWIWKKNPSGLLSAWNPRVHCNGS
jgi:hypothetical protein